MNTSPHNPFRRWLMIIVIMALVAGLGWAFWPRALPVEEAVVDMGPLQQTIDDEGRTRLREPYLIAAPVSGRLLRVILKSGAPVVADKTIVAQMKPANATPLDTRALAEAKAGVIASEAALRQAHSAARQATESQKLTAVELKRTQQLFASHSVSQQALDQARTADAVAVSVLRAAQDMVAQREAELTRARAALTSSDAPPPADSALLDIHAPVSGRVLRVLQQSATPITAGTAIMEIGDPEQDLEVVVPLRSEDAVQVSPGDPVQIERWGGPDVLHGVVERIDPRGYTKVSALGVEEKRVDVTVRLLDPPDARRGLGDDYRIEARIVIWSEPTVLRLPAGALFRDQGQWAVFVVRGGKAFRQSVDVAHNNGNQAQVVHGLEAGDRVVLYPPADLADGMRVTSSTQAGPAE